VDKQIKARDVGAGEENRRKNQTNEPIRTDTGIGTTHQSIRERERANQTRKRNIGRRGSFFRRAPEEVGKRLRFEYITKRAKKSERTIYCRILKVTPQGYGKHLRTKTRADKYARLLADMRAVLEEEEFNANYGKRRMYEKLQLDYDCPYSYNTVAKIMRANGLLRKPNKPKGLTKADAAAHRSDDLLNQDFTSDAPNEKTVTDIIEFAGIDGKIYVSAIFDCYDNACLAISLADNMRKELVIETFEQATGRYNLKETILHSDRGSQYTSDEYRRVLNNGGTFQSMNDSAGSCYGNAKCESMWARGKCEIMECYDSKKIKCEDLHKLIFRYYMSYWNNRRICSAIGGIPPMIKRDAYYEKISDEIRAG